MYTTPGRGSSIRSDGAPRSMDGDAGHGCKTGPMGHEALLRLHPALTEVLNGLADTEFGDEFRQKAVAVSTHLLTAPPIDRRAALAPHRWVLEQARGDGLPLTAAGYLKPADARELAALLPEMRDFPWAGTREVDAHPVLVFREYLYDSGLLRRYKGTLRLSKRGRECDGDVDTLWRHLADTVVPQSSTFAAHCAVTLMVYSATAERTVSSQHIARILSAHGWKHNDGSPIDERDVFPVWNALWGVLGAVGEPGQAASKEFLSRIPGDAARLLVGDALFEVSYDVGEVEAVEAVEAASASRRGKYRPVPRAPESPR